MILNHDPTIPAQEVIVSHKTLQANHPLPHFNGNPVAQTNIRN